MLIAAKRNNPRAIDRLTSQHGADVNCKGSSSEQTPLHKAAANGHEQMVEKLLLMGANMNAKDLFGWTPVMLAAKNRHYRIAQLLLARGCYANERDDNQNSAIHMAVANGSQRMLDLLIANGGNVNFANRHRATALHMATANGHRTLVYVLLKNKHLLVNAINCKGETALHIACLRGYKMIVQMLLRREETKTFLYDNGGNYIVHAAARNGHSDVVGLLLVAPLDHLGAHRTHNLFELVNRAGDSPEDLARAGGYHGIANKIKAYVKVQVDHRAYLVTTTFRIWKRRWWVYSQKLQRDKLLREAMHGTKQDSEIVCPPPPRYYCSNCKVEIAVGMRYHCEICGDYELCFNCRNKKKNPVNHPHGMSAIPTRHERAKREAAAEARRKEAERVLEMAAGRTHSESKDGEEEGGGDASSKGTSAVADDDYVGVTTESDWENDSEDDCPWRRTPRAALLDVDADFATKKIPPNFGANAYRPYAKTFYRYRYREEYGEAKSPDNIASSYKHDDRGGDGWSPKRGGPPRMRGFRYETTD